MRAVAVRIHIKILDHKAGGTVASNLRDSLRNCVRVERTIDLDRRCGTAPITDLDSSSISLYFAYSTMSTNPMYDTSQGSPLSMSSLGLNSENDLAAAQNQRNLTAFAHSVNNQMQFTPQRSELSSHLQSYPYQDFDRTRQMQNSPALTLRSQMPAGSMLSQGPPLSELLSYPAVQEMYNDLTEANRRVARALDAQASLQQEILRLSGLLQSFMSGKPMENK